LDNVIESNAHYLARELGLGSAAGTRIVRIEVGEPNPDGINIPVHGEDIIPVTITCQGLPTVGSKAGSPRTGTAYLIGPTPTIDIRRVWDFGELTQADPENYWDICNPRHPRYIGG
jgi:hypothetical protein